MQNRISSLVLTSSLALGCAGNADAPPASAPAPEQKELSQREQVVALLESIESGDEAPVAYINPEKYIQHNLGVADGLEGFGELLAHKPPEGFQVNVVRTFEDEDYVFTHTEYDFFGPKIGFDVFRFEDGRMVEHWDNLIEVAPPNPSGRTQTDGPSKAVDLGKTEETRKLVREFYETALVGGDFARASEFVDAENYAQHSPQIGDNLSGLSDAMGGLAEQGITMEFHKVHKVLAEGNFALVMAEGTFGDQPHAYYDLFRVEGGLIVEHWDVVAAIPPRDEWKNDNGKF